MAEQNDLHFKTNVQLKSIIGKDLINDDNIAILELVKNSFDADAKLVKVEYHNLKKGNDKQVNSFSDFTSRLIIQDNGKGMDISDIKDKWLNIAYSEKKLNTTQHKRRMAGAKGVGRFSCDRLGEYLNLYSKTTNNEEYFKLTIDWKKFEIEDENKEIQSIPLKFETLTNEEFGKLGFKAFDHGVLLEIIKLRSNWAHPIKNKEGKFIKWDTDKFVELKKYLEKLINPNQAFEIDDFGINIDASEFIDENQLRNEHEKFIGIVKNRIFDKLEFKSTSIDSNTLEGGKFIITKLKDKGDTVYWVKERNPFYPNIKNIKLSVYFLNSYAKAFFTRQTGIQSVNYGSIFLFINGFRITPYGDVGNDWLALDQRKAQGTKRYLGSRDIIGHIEIIDNNNDFQIISSREGIVNNENFKKLTSSARNESYFYKTLRRLERYVVEGLNWDSSIYDSQDKEASAKLKELESKIISGSIKEEELVYREDDKTKKNRIYSSIHALISAKASEVIELYINEKLITQKIEEEREVSEREFKQLIEDFSNKKIDPETLNQILQRKAQENKELEKQLKEFSKYTTNEATTKAILEIQNYKETIESQANLIENLQEELYTINKEKSSVEANLSTLIKRAETAEKNASKIQEKFELEKRKNVYLQISEKTDISKDAETLIHSIKDSSSEINASIKHIHRILSSNKIRNIELLEYLRRIENQNKKTNMLAKLIMRADLKEEKMFVNIPDFILDYLRINNILQKPIKTNHFDKKSINSKINLIDFGLAIDELLINSKKAGATEMHVSINVDKYCEIIFSDNGNGISDSLLDNPKSLFELGISSTDGSGTGLYNIKRILKESYASLTFEGNNNNRGAAFKITFE